VLLFETNYPRWLTTTMSIAVASTFVGVLERAVRLCDRAPAVRGAACGLAIYLPIWCRRRSLFIPLATLIYQFGLFDNPVALIPDVSDLPGAVLHLAADQLFQVDPV
jgi:multiple sugar transport system permease protein